MDSAIREGAEVNLLRFILTKSRELSWCVGGWEGNNIKEAHMQITISLPETPLIEGTPEESYTKVKHFLRQLELSVHHCQKALEELNKMNSELDDPRGIYPVYRVYDTDFDSEQDAKNGNGIPAIVEIELKTM